ncbi:SRPBCC family protein [Reinekea sp. G2M2-21]|uniref:SRPBCC family protein n=1 Tax=Reinekea sp. G2M2-21 TaxID=2788942 RepID=UPI0018AA622A|nr:SRPBCC family protein [Reinekea sp. G2M2-21]
MKITIQTTVNADLDTVWQAWNTPADIMQWNAASDDWHTTACDVDLRVGGQFSSRMEAKDGSMGFDFSGTYTVVEPNSRIEYSLGDDRQVQVLFEATEAGVKVTEVFDAEDQNSADMQKAGWQAILDNFARHVAQ